MGNNAGSKKILICYVYEVLRRFSDQNHKLSQSNIAALIRDVYGMESDRKAIGRNITALINAGADIATHEENGKGYYLRKRTFSDSEVRMIIDSVLASRYITGTYARDLAERLCTLSTDYLAKRIPYISQAMRWVHTDNPHVFLNIELLDEAIDARRKVSFVYNCYEIDKKLHPRHEYRYEVDPYQIVSSNGRYYLIGNYDKRDCVTNFRVDLITDVKILESKSIQFENLPNKSKSLDLADYSKYALNMYDGKKISALIRLRYEHIGDVIDWFGKDITILPDEGGYVDVRINGTDNGIRMWAIQYGCIVEVLSPAALREDIKRDIQAIEAKYI